MYNKAQGVIITQDFINKCIIKPRAWDEGEDVSEPDGEQELLSTSERQQCKMCKIAQRDTLLKPCLHVHFCFKCIEKLHKPARMRKSQRVNCPLSFCEEPIDTYVRVGY